MILALLLLALAGPPKVTAPKGPSVHLRLWPCRGDCIVMPGAQLDARVTVRDPGGELRCPSIELESRRKGTDGVEDPVADYRSAVEELSCDAYGREQPREYRLPPRPLKFWAVGLHVVRVKVRGGDRRRTYSAARDVLVAGAGGP